MNESANDKYQQSVARWRRIQDESAPAEERFWLMVQQHVDSCRNMNNVTMEHLSLEDREELVLGIEAYARSVVNGTPDPEPLIELHRKNRLLNAGKVLVDTIKNHYKQTIASSQERG